MRLFRRFRNPDLERPLGVESFSQDGEDLVLRSLFERSGLDVNGGGFYVDVGAYDPVRYSNTYLFYQLGWSGVNLDANEGIVEKFDAIRPNDTTLQVCVSDEEGEAKFYSYNEPALNGIDNDRSEELRETDYRLEAVIPLPVRPLRQILKDTGSPFNGEMSFLTIDVEGHEKQVLQGLDWEAYPFHFVLIEQREKTLGDVVESDLYEYLKSLHYAPVACTGRTVIYQRVSGG